MVPTVSRVIIGDESEADPLLGSVALRLVGELSAAAAKHGSSVFVSSSRETTLKFLRAALRYGKTIFSSLGPSSLTAPSLRSFAIRGLVLYLYTNPSYLQLHRGRILPFPCLGCWQLWTPSPRLLHHLLQP